MRYTNKSEISLSEDVVSEPKQIRFSACESLTEDALLKDGGGDTKSYAIGTHVINMDHIVEGRWIYVKPSEDIELVIDAATPTLKLIKDKPTSIWAKFAAISVIVATASTRITIAIAGE